MSPINPKSLLKMLGAKAGSNPKGGMADTVPSMIDGQAPAALSAGEYVIPADVVALIGDGNTDAGVEVLDSAIAELRQAKTGKKDQPNPMAELFKGGKVKGKYASGGKVAETVNKNQKIAPPTESPNGPSLSAIIQRLVGGIA